MRSTAAFQCCCTYAHRYSISVPTVIARQPVSPPTEIEREEDYEDQSIGDWKEFQMDTESFASDSESEHLENVLLEQPQEEETDPCSEFDYMDDTESDYSPSVNAFSRPAKRVSKPTRGRTNRKTSSKKRQIPPSSINKPIKCTHANCSFTANRAGDLRRHLFSLVHKPVPTIRCGIPGCDKFFTRPDACKRHMLEVKH